MRAAAQTPAVWRAGAAVEAASWEVTPPIVSFAAPPAPTSMKASATQPCHENCAVCTIPLPTVQPPASAAPTPIPIPPKIDLTTVVA